MENLNEIATPVKHRLGDWKAIEERTFNGGAFTIRRWRIEANGLPIFNVSIPSEFGDGGVVSLITALPYLLRSCEYAVDHLNGTEPPETVLFLRTAIAKAAGND